MQPITSTNLFQRISEAGGHPPALTTPFENIALAFSGGGFRAASFSLGVLSYFNEIHFLDHGNNNTKTSLLNKVTYLSSASGGTIATILYALHSVSPLREDFSAFYKKLYAGLRGNDLLKSALTILTTNGRWKDRPLKSRNIINAFSIAYDENLFDGATVGHLILHKNTSHVEEVCFNTTEFYRGLLFRQQVKLKEDKKEPFFFYGNFIVNVQEEAWAKIKLGDVLAASSCFPAGFEPLIYPRDFTYAPPGEAALSIEDLTRTLHIEKQTDDQGERTYRKNPQFGFMDGGITDNQGLESMMRADERRRNRESSFAPFDLMLVNDVGSHFMDPYKVPPAKQKSFWRNINLNRIFLILSVIIVVSVVLGYRLRYHLGWTILWSAAFAFSTLILLLLFSIGNQIKGTTNSKSSFNLSNNFGPVIVGLLSRFLKSTSLNVLTQMIKARASSVITLNSDVFLKRIRFLLYNSFYSSPVWKNRGKSNHVYDLSFTNDINRTSRDCIKDLEPSRDMQIVAENAYQMGTTLWFDQSCVEEKHSLECLVATGHFSTCYNLLEYIRRLKNNPDLFESLSGDYKNRVDGIEQTLLLDYEKFKEDPFFLVNRYGNQMEEYKAVKVGDIPFPENFKGIK